MTRYLFTLTVLSALSVSAPSFAQEDGGGRRLGSGRVLSAVMLLRQEAVQAELDLSAEQKEKIAALGERLRNAGGNLREMSQEERQQWMAEMQERMAKADDYVREFLSEDQVRRLQQIRVQALGLNAASDPAVAKELGITDEQREKMQNLVRELREGGAAGGREALREKMEQAVGGILTAEQKEKLEQLRGERFDVSSLQLWGQGGGRRGGQ